MEAVIDSEDEWIVEEASSSGELLSRVQELEDELKDSERVQMDLIEANTALQNKLKASWEEEGRTRQENASLKKKLVSALTSQVSRMEGFRLQKTIKSALCDTSIPYCTGGTASQTPHISLPPSSPTATSRNYYGGWR